MFNLFFKKDACPYCSFVFPKKPKRSSLCPSCKKRFFVSSGKLITEGERLKEDLYIATGHFGISYNDINEAIKKGGMNRSERDYIHGLLNLAIFKEKSNNNNPEKLASIYQIMIYRAKANNETYQHIIPLFEKEQHRFYSEMTAAKWTKSEIDKMVKEDIENLIR